MKILVTGAGGQLGRLVIGELERIPGIEVVAGVRRPESASFTAGVNNLIRKVDYDDPTSLVSSMVGIDRLLLISSSEVGQRSTVQLCNPLAWRQAWPQRLQTAMLKQPREHYTIIRFS